MFKELKEIHSRPLPFQFYTSADLWTDEYTAKQMLENHLSESTDLSSRKKDFIDKSVQWIISHFKVDINTEIADFGCGPGLYTNRLAKSGAIVTGIDFSENSLNYAKQIAEKEGLDINYIQSDYLDFETSNRFDLITMIYCDFCALSPEQRRILLSKFFSFLKPGGAVLLDVFSINGFEQKQESVHFEPNQLFGFWSADDYYGFINIFKYENEKVILDKHTIIEESRTRVVYNWLQYFTKDSLQKEFEENGFKIAEIYSDVAGNMFAPESTEFAVVAVKP